MKGIIYKITTSLCDELYVGSTEDALEERWKRHTHKYIEYLRTKDRNNWYSVFNLFEEFGIDNCEIELIKEYEVCDKKHLFAYEQLWINKLNSLNEQNTMSFGRFGDYMYRLNNKEAISERNKRYRNNHPDRILEQRRNYLENIGRQLYDCDCGSIITRQCLSRHLKSKKHINYLNSNL
jgi:hypothetical protein